MKYGEFMAALRKGIPHVMLLAGEEPYYIGKAEAAVLRALLPDEAERAAAVQYVERDPSLGDLTELLATMPFLSDKTVTVLRGTELFREKKSAGENPAEGKTKGKAKDKAMEGLLSVLSDMPETNYVISRAARRRTSGKSSQRRWKRSAQCWTRSRSGRGPSSRGFAGNWRKWGAPSTGRRRRIS